MIFPDALHKYHRNRLITLEITALSNRMFFFDLTVVRSNAYYLKMILHTHTIVIRPLENFLAALEVA